MMRAIVTGMIATYPVGGVAWDYAQYAVGLERLGWDVYYLEDTGGPTYDPVKGEYGDDCSFGVQFLKDSLTALSPNLGQRWFFRAADDRTYGIESKRFRDLVGQVDLFLNVSGGTLLRDEYMASACKVLVDTDPGWNHFVNYPRWDREPGWQGTHGYRSHDHFLTYAERIGTADCILPTLGISWHPTRPCVVMDKWSSEPPGSKWTTVLTWNNFKKPVEYQGRLYGTKELEFPKVERLPEKVPTSHFELAVGGASPTIDAWRKFGWHVVDSHSVSRSLDEYRHYVQQSRGEFSVAKNLYSATKSGWFSCRTICYLAAGRPAVVQDTGFSQLIPVGDGLFAFHDLAGAVSAVEAVERNYSHHQDAARTIAREFFSTDRVLDKLLRDVGLR
jgi:hypothetical protein